MMTVEGMKIGEVKELIKNTPYHTKRHQEALKRIQEFTEDDYDGEHVLCVKRKSLLKYVNKTRLSREDEINAFLCKHVSVMEEGEISFIPRHIAEYNLNYKQFTAFILIHDDVNVLTLRKLNNNRVTMIGGHIDYHYKAMVEDIRYLARRTAIKELKEEVRHPKEFTPSYDQLKPILVMNTASEFDKILHGAIIFEYKVKDINGLDFTSNEENKHVVEVHSINDIINKNRSLKVDNWLWNAAKKINNNR